ncbi:MAG: hypothetical protein GX658_07885 [Clostridiales bacterium]|nr:hypothetical protein [Clostridia bacterium]MEE1292412.1 hypothetical protein [Acutalibacteraceae bacterium]NLD30297.1 hypothetical protein [Clostridiales bacterium]MBQ1313302.1 hypothetical protein [Clostridia bacterium]MBQ1528868.1 hypothetical protein [Clostridia bacterium]
MKKSIRSIVAVLIALTMMLAFAACNSKNAADTAKTTKATESDQFETATDNDAMEYVSPDGWRVTYDAKTMESMEIDDHAAQFTYIGESAGTNSVEIRYLKDKQPEEVLYDLTSTWTNDQDDIERSEGIFPGTTDKWGFWRELPADEDGSRLGQTAIAGEYNGGVLLFTITSHMSGKDEIDIPVSDAISELINGIQYKDGFKDQKMFDYYAGTYKAAKDNKAYKSIVLNKDHSGVLTDAKGKKTNIMWGSIELTDTDNNKDIEYTIEGDDLMMKVGNNWFEFSK